MSYAQLISAIQGALEEQSKLFQMMQAWWVECASLASSTLIFRNCDHELRGVIVKIQHTEKGRSQINEKSLGIHVDHFPKKWFLGIPHWLKPKSLVGTTQELKSRRHETTW